MMPVWTRCHCCENFWCRLHQKHAHECDCPPIEEWDTDPYTEDHMPRRLPATLTAALLRAIAEDGRSINAIALAAGVSQPQLQRFVSGQRTLTLPVAEKIAAELKLELKPSPVER